MTVQMMMTRVMMMMMTRMITTAVIDDHDDDNSDDHDYGEDDIIELVYLNVSPLSQTGENKRSRRNLRLEGGGVAPDALPAITLGC